LEFLKIVFEKLPLPIPFFGEKPTSMTTFSIFLTLIKKEFLLEFRQRYALSGILLYVISTVFVVYSAAIKIQPPVWNVLFWIILLFASVNAVAKSFVQENGNRQLYFYQIADPVALVLAKIVYNFCLLLVIGTLAFGAFSLVAGNPVKNSALFMGVLTLGSLGFSITFTFISAIAAKANQSATLMAILSFPIILPILLSLIKLSAIALRLIQDTAWMQDVWTLVAIDAILIVLTFILFPFLWKD
jgi:heme exporter protein B